MPRARMILVKVAMQIPQRTMIGTVLSPTVETLLVRVPVRLVQLTMKFPVRSVIMSIINVVMGQCRCGWCRYSQHRRSNENFADGHDTSPVQAAPPSEERLHPPLQYGGEVEPYRNAPFSDRSWHVAKVELSQRCWGGPHQRRRPSTAAWGKGLLASLGSGAR